MERLRFTVNEEVNLLVGQKIVRLRWKTGKMAKIGCTSREHNL